MRTRLHANLTPLPRAARLLPICCMGHLLSQNSKVYRGTDDGGRRKKGYFPTGGHVPTVFETALWQGVYYEELPSKSQEGRRAAS